MRGSATLGFHEGDKMSEGKYFLKLGGVLVLGLIALIIAAVIFWILLPFIILAFVGGLVLVLIFIFIWFVVYIAMIIGAALYYIFKPMKVSEEDKSYKIEGAKEAGRRQKGKSRKKK